MNFNNHFELKDRHAFLGASTYHWVNYDDEKIITSYGKYLAKEKGTRLHAFAEECIKLGIKLPATKNALNRYVNDAIGFRMVTEQPLYYSENCFGTADAILFKKNKLRIHDFKSGTSPTSMRQLHVYTALFCLEYHIDPQSIEIELRIYQGTEVDVEDPERSDILFVMERIRLSDKLIDQIDKEV